MPTMHDSNEGQTRYVAPEEQMRKEFERSYALNVDDNASFLLYGSGPHYDDSYVQMAWLGWQACAAQSAEKVAEFHAEIVRLNNWSDRFSDAQIKERQTGEIYQRELREKIARLEEAKGSWIILCNKANDRNDELLEQLEAAQADNARLREELEIIRSVMQHPLHAGEEELSQLRREARNALHMVDRALAQPLDTSALDAYVVKHQNSCPLCCGVSRAQWHDEAWALFQAKRLDDGALAKVNIHTMRSVFDATFDALRKPAPLPPAPTKQDV